MRAKIIVSDILIKLLVLCAALLFTEILAAQAQESSAKELFNGKDFSGWTFCMRSNAAPQKTWSIVDGVIHCTGKPVGYMRTKKSFRDYKLTVEWRFVKIARHADNTGILINMQLPDKIWPMCVECQGQYKNQGDFWLQGGATAKDHPGTGRRNIHVPKTGPSNESQLANGTPTKLLFRTIRWKPLSTASL